MKILMVSSEAAPFAKAGGLGDAVSALARALSRAGHDVRVLLPPFALRIVKGRVEEGRGVRVYAVPSMLPVSGIPSLDGLPRAGSTPTETPERRKE